MFSPLADHCITVTGFYGHVHQLSVVKVGLDVEPEYVNLCQTMI